MSITKKNSENKMIESFAKNIECYSKTLTPKEQEILSYLVLSTMDPITRTKWLLSGNTNYIISSTEIDLLDSLITKYTKK